MSDVIYLLVLVGFFFAAAGLVNLCQRVIGDDETVSTTATPATDADAPSEGPPTSAADPSAAALVTGAAR